jgi:hypothetical protein
MTQIINLAISVAFLAAVLFTFEIINDHVKSTGSIAALMTIVSAFVFCVNLVNNATWLDLATAMATGAAGFCGKIARTW